jgi:transcriptional regulator NrdR family protein
MICECGEKMECIDSRWRKPDAVVSDGYVRRRHSCGCGLRVTTFEISEEAYRSLQSKERILRRVRNVMNGETSQLLNSDES